MTEQKKDPPPRDIIFSHAAIGNAVRSRGIEPVYPVTAATAGPNPLSEPCTKCTITWDDTRKINLRECTNECKGG